MTDASAVGSDASRDETRVTRVRFEPARISTDVQAVVLVTVANPRSVDDTHLVELEFDGDVVETREVSVPARSAVTVQFARSIDTPGTYTAAVEGETATVTVVEPAEGVETVTSTQFDGFGPFGALFALVLALVLAVRRR